MSEFVFIFGLHSGNPSINLNEFSFYFGGRHTPNGTYLVRKVGGNKLNKYGHLKSEE